MRVRFLEVGPAFEHVFGIRPWQLQQYTAAELNARRRYLDRMNEG